MGALGGAFVGLFYWLINDHSTPDQMFNDKELISYPGRSRDYYQDNYQNPTTSNTPQNQYMPEAKPESKGKGVMLNFDIAE